MHCIYNDDYADGDDQDKENLVPARQCSKYKEEKTCPDCLTLCPSVLRRWAADKMTMRLMMIIVIKMVVAIMITIIFLKEIDFN